ncbi:site-specific integrase [Mesorhizobium sp. M4A.F.Ca.ET.050.02.1.1]|uniref:tyrosine-type recombinase/integrase n=1 Tax=Mesorhizobium sp. M4A.F.Ca.ET.050.02.1.1 TaxID=2496754 RepID=UPI000FCA9038|nr:site-specific integrase [Mesorhizobium sp. M4A.F.Ca.ET.050.02.1.1]RUX47769.1 site-specific integrase [Mesorhizobium sp. M4A.F.Ca.ET.050.02.1.1]
MARMINKLSAAFVNKASKPGRYSDGGGLYLQISQFNTKSWVFRFMIDSKARTYGLGSFPKFSLAEARERARKAGQQVSDGVDPISAKAEKKAARKVAASQLLTFAEAAERYKKAHAASWSSTIHAAQWSSTLEAYAYPIIGELPVRDVDGGHIMQILEPIWTSKTKTATRVRGRIEVVLDWAKAHGFRTGDNPAAWRGNLDVKLAKPAAVAAVEHLPALPYTDIGGFVAEVRAMEGARPAALEFTILTAMRTNAVLGARWPEIDRDSALWVIPADRMKGKKGARKEHRVPLTKRALEILDGLAEQRTSDSDYIFAGDKPGKPMSEEAMSRVLKRRMKRTDITVHGFRSTFRDWAAEATNFPREIAEAALAHDQKSKVEAAYQRGDMLEKRRRLMTAWANYCATSAKAEAKADNVTPIRAA